MTHRLYRGWTITTGAAWTEATRYGVRMRANSVLDLTCMIDLRERERSETYEQEDRALELRRL